MIWCMAATARHRRGGGEDGWNAGLVCESRVKANTFLTDNKAAARHLGINYTQAFNMSFLIPICISFVLFGNRKGEKEKLFPVDLTVVLLSWLFCNYELSHATVMSLLWAVAIDCHLRCCWIKTDGSHLLTFGRVRGWRRLSFLCLFVGQILYCCTIKVEKKQGKWETWAFVLDKFELQTLNCEECLGQWGHFGESSCLQRAVSGLSSV